MKKRLYILLILFFTIIMVGCNKDATVKEVSSKVKKDVSIGTTLGLNDETAVSQLNETFHIKKGNEFNPSINLHNRDTKSNSFRLYFMLDYNESTIIYNNKELTFIDIKLDPFEEKTIDIELEDLSNGLHDFIVLSVRNPDKLLLEKKFFPPGHFNLAKRTTLIVGGSDSPPKVDYINYKAFDSSEEMPAILTTKPSKSLENEGITILPYNSNSELWLNFNSTNVKKYAIFAYLGDEYLPIKNRFVEVDNKGIINIPLDIKLVKNKNLVIGVVENPFEKQTDETRIPWFVQTLNRVSVK
ncbi:hypothetical protein [Virgibacillus sp. 6R]|uniref:hypothetical protein n=1 Tax=Metabacillus sp. 22489 TaxID=3453928 RepID=UPI0011A952F9